MTNTAPSDFDTLIAQALAASQAGDSEAALEGFRRAAVAEPAAALPHFLRGSELAALGRYAQAEEALADATRLAPGFSLARYQLGLLQFSGGRPAAALLSWEPLLALPDEDALPHFVRGFESLARDAFDEALAHYRAGLARQPDNPALVSDIEKVIAGIEALRGPADGGAVQGHDGAQAEDEPAGGHVLLSQYRQQGPLH